MTRSIPLFPQRSLRIVLFFMALAVVACSSGGGGGGNKNSGPEKPGDLAGDTYYVGGIVRGLKGIVKLSVGSTQVTLNKNGAFSFVEPFALGATYNVRIAALPAGQSCELHDSTGLAGPEIRPVIVDCADMVEVPLSLKLPEGYRPEDLSVRSNFQQKSLSGAVVDEDGIVSLELYAFHNNFVALLDANNKPIYLTFVSDPNRSYTLDEASTATALLFLEPSMYLAMKDRSQTLPSDASRSQLSVLSAGLAMVDYLAPLRESISAHVSAGGTLDLPDGELTAAFSSGLRLVLRDLSESFPLDPDSENNPDLAASATDKNIVVTEGERSGMAFQFGELKSGSTFEVNAFNLSRRSLSLALLRGSLEIIRPGEQFLIDLENGLASQASFSVEIYGPGALGSAPAGEVLVRVANVSADSAVDQYFLPSIGMLLGLKNPLQPVVKDCIDENTPELLGIGASSDGIDQGHISQGHYHRAFSVLSDRARGELIDQEADTSALAELMNCPKFGVGVLLPSNKEVALAQVASLARLVSPYSLAISEEDDQQDLFTLDNLSAFVVDLQQSYAHRTWEISNQLTVKALTAEGPFYEGVPIAFTASCFNPLDEVTVPCDVSWDFESETLQGSEVSHAYLSAGVYQVAVRALDTAGAKAESTVTLEVLPKVPELRVVDEFGREVVNGYLAHDFGLTRLGESSTVELSMENTGADELVLSSVSSSNNVFVIQPGFETVLMPLAGQASKTPLRITFTPVEQTQQTAEISLVSNDSTTPEFNFQLRGYALDFPPLPGDGSGGGDPDTDQAVWVAYNPDGAKSETYVASRVSADYLEESGILNIRGFVSETEDFPQFAIQVHGFDLDSNTRGLGTYSLENQGQQSCLGFFAEDSADNGRQFCTDSSRSDPTPYTGRVTVSATDEGAKRKRALFHFKAQAREFCVEGEACPELELTGEVSFGQF